MFKLYYIFLVSPTCLLTSMSRAFIAMFIHNTLYRIIICEQNKSSPPSPKRSHKIYSHCSRKPNQ